MLSGASFRGRWNRGKFSKAAGLAGVGGGGETGAGALWGEGFEPAGGSGTEGGAKGLAAPGGVGWLGTGGVAGATTTCLQWGQRTWRPRSCSPTPMRRPQNGHGNVCVGMGMR